LIRRARPTGPGIASPPTTCPIRHLSEVRNAWQAFPVAVIVGGGWAAWSALNAFLATLTPTEQRSRVFSINFIALNAGTGIGGLLGAAIARVDDPITFQLLYWIDGLTYALAGVILFLATDRHTAPPIAAPVPDTHGQAGWRAVLADPVIRRVAVVFALVAFVGYGQLSAGLQAFATGPAGLSASAVGAAFAVNTLIVLAVQWFITRRLHGHRRTRGIALFGAVMAAAWLVTGTAALAGGTATPVICLLAGMALIALAETLWAPTGYTILNDLAPEHLRGRYNSLGYLTPTGYTILNDLAPEHLRGRYNSLGYLTWELSATIRPLFASGLLAGGRSAVYIAAMVTGSALAGLSALRLGRHLTAAQNGVLAPTREPQPQE